MWLNVKEMWVTCKKEITKSLPMLNVEESAEEFFISVFNDIKQNSEQERVGTWIWIQSTTWNKQKNNKIIDYRFLKLKKKSKITMAY